VLFQVAKKFAEENPLESGMTRRVIRREDLPQELRLSDFPIAFLRVDSLNFQAGMPAIESQGIMFKFPQSKQDWTGIDLKIPGKLNRDRILVVSEGSPTLKELQEFRESIRDGFLPDPRSVIPQAEESVKEPGG